MRGSMKVASKPALRIALDHAEAEATDLRAKLHTATRNAYALGLAMFLGGVVIGWAL